MSRALTAFAFAAILLFSGCVGSASKESPPSAPSAVSNSSVSSVPIDDGSQPIAKAQNDTGHMPHMHDYWRGRERVVLFDGDVTPDPTTAPDATLGHLVQRHQVAAGGFEWRLPDNKTVYEGTGRLELTASWQDPRTTGMRVLWRTAEGPTWSEPSSLETGKPLGLDVKPAACDMPHSRISRWAFAFEPPPDGALLGAFHLKIEIVKMRDIMLFPAHPRLFGDAHEKILLAKDGRDQQVSYVKRIPNFVTGGDFTEHEIAPAAAVPMETLSLLVKITVKKASASVGEVSDIRFFWHGADSSEFHRTTHVNGSMATKTFTWRVPVEMENTDSPYAQASQWRFVVEAATTFEGQDPTCGGCVDTDIEYHIDVVAYDHPIT